MIFIGGCRDGDPVAAVTADFMRRTPGAQFSAAALMTDEQLRQVADGQPVAVERTCYRYDPRDGNLHAGPGES